MKAKIQKWGNSLAVRVPKVIAEQVGVKSNDVVEMQVKEGKISPPTCGDGIQSRGSSEGHYG